MAGPADIPSTHTGTVIMNMVINYHLKLRQHCQGEKMEAAGCEKGQRNSVPNASTFFASPLHD
jgi:hypothetical protein